MEIELLVVPDCPNEATAAALLAEALADVGLAGTQFRTTVISTQQQAEERAFIGSPTIRLDGRDPFQAPESAPALACRIYPNSTGSTGVPELSALRQALDAASSTAT